MEGFSNPICAYVIELSLNALTGTNWNAPVMSEDTTINSKDLAGYVLKGHFREYCEKHIRLDNPAMCYVNKDVYNRIYIGDAWTIIKQGVAMKESRMKCVDLP